MAIRNRIRELRQQAGKTQTQVVAELAERYGERPFSRPMLSMMEEGTRPISIESLDALCGYFGTQPGDLLVYEPEEEREAVPA